jgi:hypothetical protein
MDRAASDETFHIPQFEGSDGARVQGQTEFVTTIQGVLGVLLPAAFAGVRKMQDSAQSIGVEKAWKHLGNIVRVCRRGKLIGHGIYLFALASALDYAIDKTRAIGTENPGNAHHQMLVVRLQN